MVLGQHRASSNSGNAEIERQGYRPIQVAQAAIEAEEWGFVDDDRGGGGDRASDVDATLTLLSLLAIVVFFLPLDVNSDEPIIQVVKRAANLSR